ncbi:MAG: CDP-alcohol phosphatidyltransferase family protein [Candidatus Bathyarchaeia archaeon]
MQKLILIPTIISSLRIAVLPLFFYLYNAGNITACLILLAFSAATDFLDGNLARRLKATSRFGGYYDTTTDFILVFGIFTFFSVKGDYPVWLLLVITLSFVQFLASSLYSKKLYDPVGKYTGSALYIGIVLTLIFPSQAMFSFVEFAFLGFFLVSLVSRIVTLTRKYS